MKQSQNNMILDYLRTHRSITPKEAEKMFGCMRLAARIKELRDDGHNIVMEKKPGKNMFGRDVTFAEYRLEE